MQKATPDLEGKAETIQQHIVRINHQRAQLAMEYKDFVRVSIMHTLIIDSRETGA